MVIANSDRRGILAVVAILAGFIAFFALLALFNGSGIYIGGPPHPPVPVVSFVIVSADSSGWVFTVNGTFASDVQGTVTISDVQLNGVSVRADLSPSLPLTFNITDSFSFKVIVGSDSNLVSGQAAAIMISLDNGNSGQKTLKLP